MVTVKLEIHDDLVSAIKKITSQADTAVEVEIPEGSVLFDNVINLKVIEKEAERAGKTITVVTDDPVGYELLAFSDTDTDDFVSKTIPLGNSTTTKTSKVSDRKILPISFKFPKIVFGMPSLRFLKSGRGIGMKIIGLLPILLILGVLGYLVFWVWPSATVDVTVKSDKFTKSLPVKVLKDTPTSADDKILSGTGITTVVSETKSFETTGEKIVGEKASGEIKIYNRTTSEKKFEEGDEVYYEDDDDKYYFEIREDVTVPAAETTEPINPEDDLIITPGEATVEVRAKEIGGKYNIDKDKTIKFEDISTSEVIGETNEDIDGGSSDTVKVVAQEDIDQLSAQVLEELVSKAEEAIKDKESKSQKIILGSYLTNVTSETFSAELDEETEELELTTELSITALSYSEDSLKQMFNKYIEELTPEGYEISDEDKELRIEVLGNSDASILNSNEADLQVTLKATALPIIDEEEIKQNIVGKTFAQAQKVLGSIKNIENYEIKTNFAIPLISRMPTNPENIEVNVKTK